jgi:hypothetical protein
MRQAAQGDLLVTRIDTIPYTASPVRPERGRHIVAHSETGHHHWIGATGTEYLADPADPLRAYLRCEVTATLLHDRAWDTHAPIALAPGCYELRRQREYVPEGWRRVED